MPFDFLNNLGTSLASYFAPAVSTVKNVFDSIIPHQQIYAQGSSPAPQLNIPAPAASTVPSTPTSPATTPPSADIFSQGFNNFSPNIPVSTASADFARAAGQLPPTIDPLLPAVLALMETGGGANTVAANNPFNISGTQGGSQGFINYPDFTTALLGGQNGPDVSSGFMGQILNNPAYAPFRQSGNLADFFNVYTPPGPAYGNPSLPELLARYNDLRSLFPY